MLLGVLIPIRAWADTRGEKVGAAVEQATDNVSNTQSANNTDNTANSTTGTVNNTTDKAANTVNNAADKATSTVNNTTDKSGSTVDNTTDKATSTVNNRTDKAGSTVTKTADKATNTVKKTADKAGSTVSRTTDKATNTVNRTTDKAASSINNTTDKAGSTVSRTTDKATSGTVGRSTQPAGLRDQRGKNGNSYERVSSSAKSKDVREGGARKKRDTDPLSRGLGLVGASERNEPSAVSLAAKLVRGGNAIAAVSDTSTQVEGREGAGWRRGWLSALAFTGFSALFLTGVALLLMNGGGAALVRGRRGVRVTKKPASVVAP